MAVVVKYARSYKDPASTALAPAVHGEGRVRIVTTGAMPVAAGDSTASRFYLVKVPSNAIILPLGTLHNSAIAGLTSVNIGVWFGLNSGDSVNTNLFANAVNMETAANRDFLLNVTSGGAANVANQGKSLWQMLGLPNDPGLNYDIVARLAAEATGAGTISAMIAYAIA